MCGVPRWLIHVAVWTGLVPAVQPRSVLARWLNDVHQLCRGYICGVGVNDVVHDVCAWSVRDTGRVDVVHCVRCWIVLHQPDDGVRAVSGWQLQRPHQPIDLHIV